MQSPADAVGPTLTKIDPSFERKMIKLHQLAKAALNNKGNNRPNRDYPQDRVQERPYNSDGGKGQGRPKKDKRAKGNGKGKNGGKGNKGGNVRQNNRWDKPKWQKDSFSDKKRWR